MAGVDLLTIKELGGWRPLSMVARYAHLSPSHRSQAIERLVTRAATIEDTRLPERGSTVISTAKIDQTFGKYGESVEPGAGVEPATY